MARPRSQQDDERKRRRMVVFFSLFMIALMVFSVAEVIFYNPSANTDLQMVYGDYEFTLEERANGGSVLVTKIGGTTVEFQNLPVQVTYLPVDPVAIALMRSAPQIVLSADPYLDAQQASLIDYGRLQLELATRKTVNAISVPKDGYLLPVVNCSMASPQMPVLYFNWSNETGSVTLDGACIIMTGSDRDLMRLKDRVIFEYHGILNQGQIAE